MLAIILLQPTFQKKALIEKLQLGIFLDSQSLGQVCYLEEGLGIDAAEGEVLIVIFADLGYVQAVGGEETFFGGETEVFVGEGSFDGGFGDVVRLTAPDEHLFDFSVERLHAEGVEI